MGIGPYGWAWNAFWRFLERIGHETLICVAVVNLTHRRPKRGCISGPAGSGLTGSVVERGSRTHSEERSPNGGAAQASTFSTAAAEASTSRSTSSSVWA